VGRSSLQKFQIKMRFLVVKTSNLPKLANNIKVPNLTMVPNLTKVTKLTKVPNPTKVPSLIIHNKLPSHYNQIFQLFNSNSLSLNPKLSCFWIGSESQRASKFKVE
jgi:hypothetical protein